MLATSPEGKVSLEICFRSAAKVFAPPPKLTVSEWARLNRKMSTLDSAEAGNFDPNRARYQVGIADAFTDPTCSDIVVVMPAQTGKTMTMNNCIGYVIDQDPGPMMVVQPSKKDAEEWSKDRFMEGMVAVTPCLRSKVLEEKPGKSGNDTIAHKRFPGGQLTVAWSNSPSRLASRPIRYIFFDETDKYKPHRVQGDPIKRGQQRLKTFWNSKSFMCSTPTLQESSRIIKEYSESSQGKYNIKCPDCEEWIHLEFFENKDSSVRNVGHLSWPKIQTSSGTVHKTDEAYCVCKACGAVIEESEKQDLVLNGEWIHRFPEKSKRGFYVSALYSPWVRWQELADEFLVARGDVEALRMFYNESLGLPWEVRGDSIKASWLKERCEQYDAQVPQRVLVLTAGVDTQDDRLEYEIRGWDDQMESWGIQYGIILGDPNQVDVWNKLDEVLSATFVNADGVEFPVISTMIDSGGHCTDAVYRYVSASYRITKHIHASKGRAGLLPIVPRTPTRLKEGGYLYGVGVDTAKEAIFRNLGITEHGPGFIHFPLDERYDDEYFEQVTAEKMVRKSSGGQAKIQWIKRRARNEALDIIVLTLAALKARAINWKAVRMNLEKTKKKLHTKETPNPGAAPKVIEEPRKTNRTKKPLRVIGKSFVTGKSF